MRAAATILGLGLPCAAAVAATPPPAADAVRRIDAVVADRHGLPITNLAPSDLELIVDGVAQPIVAAAPRAVRRFIDAPAPPIVTDLDEATAAREPGTRVFAFYLDDAHIQAGLATTRARDMVGDFIDQKVHTRDLTLVVRGVDASQGRRFSRDRGLAHGALAALVGRRGRADGGPGGLQALTLRLRALRPDRGVLVIVSEALDGDLELVARAASDAHLTVYVFDPSQGRLAGGGPPPRDAAGRLAADTGGLAFAAAGAIAGFARIAHDTEAFWSVTFDAGRRDEARHTVDLRVRRREAQVRAPAAYWVTPGTRWTEVAATAAAAPLPRRLPRRSAAIDTWYGLERDPAGGLRMIVTWEPARTLSAPARVTITARSPSGAVLVERRVAPVGRAGPGLDDSARFAVPAGTIEIDLVVLDDAGSVLDTEARDLEVPDVATSRPPGGLLSAALVRADTALDLTHVRRDAEAAPAASRIFRRSDRLLVRVPTIEPSVRVTARLLDRTGQPMRVLEPLAALPRDAAVRFALPLASFAPGSYQVEVVGTVDGDTLIERVGFRVAG